MDALYDLKEMLCKELEEYGKKGEMTTGTLDVVDKLAHTIKNIDKILEAYEEEGYSSEGSYRGRGSYRSNRGGSYRSNRSYNSYAQRRDGRGRYSREGYSRADETEEMVETIRGMMQELPEEVRRDAQRFVQKLEQM